MTNEILTKGSLCSGTGALDRATPGELRWVAETAPAPAALLRREHPWIENKGSITVPASFTRSQVDLLTSGDPCQSMSAAGRQLASDDERFLWPDVMNVIHEVRPREIFLENVQNIVSVPLVKGGERGGVLRLRLENLREAGYEVRWTVLGACAVGAPHHRHRWFLRARYVGAAAPEAVRLVNGCGAPRPGGRNLLPTPTTRDGVGGPGTSPKRTGGMNLRTVAARLDGRWGRFAQAIELWESALGRPAPKPTEAAPRGGLRLSAALSEWMMGYPEGYLTRGVTRNEALRMAGNGVVEIQARAAWDMLG